MAKSHEIMKKTVNIYIAHKIINAYSNDNYPTLENAFLELLN